MTDKEKIREEIEKLKSNLVYGACSSQVAMETMCKEEAYNEVLAILDTMQEDPVSEDLEKEIEKYFANWLQGASDEGCFNANSELVSIYDCHRIARHFAKWKKERILAKAVDVEVKVDAGGYPYIPQMELYDYDKDIPLSKAGDKYKVILIKEE